MLLGRLIEVAKSDKKEGVTTYRIPKSGQKLPLDRFEQFASDNDLVKHIPAAAVPLL